MIVLQANLCKVEKSYRQQCAHDDVEVAWQDVIEDLHDDHPLIVIRDKIYYECSRSTYRSYEEVYFPNGDYAGKEWVENVSIQSKYFDIYARKFGSNHKDVYDYMHWYPPIAHHKMCVGNEDWLGAMADGIRTFSFIGRELRTLLDAGFRPYRWYQSGVLSRALPCGEVYCTLNWIGGKLVKVATGSPEFGWPSYEQEMKFIIKG